MNKSSSIDIKQVLASPAMKLSRLFSQILEEFNLANERDVQDAILLSHHGWYLCSSIPTGSAWKALSSARAGYPDQAENICASYYRAELPALEERLCIRHKDRKNLLGEAFECHRTHLYFASTILFTSQADGLGDGKLLSKGKSKKYLSKQHSPRIATEVLSATSAITAGYGSKSNFFSDLNRHDMMHGLSSSYGTEINSLKALSLLMFTSDFVGRYNHGTP